MTAPFEAAIPVQTIEDPPAGFLCKSPFEYAHVQANGDVYPCCPSKFGRVIGNLAEQSIEEIWSSPEAQEVRASMIDGSYRFCNAQACEYLRKVDQTGERRSPPELVDWNIKRGLLDERRTPRIINLGSDRTCNLACSYCRADMYVPTAADRERVEIIDRNLFDLRLAHTDRIVLLGEGDPFSSPYYRDKLRHCDWSLHPDLRIKIQTNGLLLTPAMWDSIARSHTAIDWISVSVDAATDATYEVNRGGDFQMLLRNLDFIANLRALGGIQRFCINFLAQTNNYREMPAFVSLGKNLDCDQIEFQRLENWGTYSEEEYRLRAVHEPTHPEHEEFLQVMQNPLMNDELAWTLKLGVEEMSAGDVGIMSWDDCNDASP